MDQPSSNSSMIGPTHHRAQVLGEVLGKLENLLEWPGSSGPLKGPSHGTACSGRFGPTWCPNHRLRTAWAHRQHTRRHLRLTPIRFWMDWVSPTRSAPNVSLQTALRARDFPRSKRLKSRRRHHDPHDFGLLQAYGALLLRPLVGGRQVSL